MVQQPWPRELPYPMGAAKKKKKEIRKRKKKSVYVIHHSKRIRGGKNDHFKDAEKAFDKIQYPFMIKTLREGNFPNLLRVSLESL